MIDQDAATFTALGTELSEDDDDFAPLALLEKLKAKAAREPAPEDQPDHLPLSMINLLPALFQPRGLADHHIHDLTKSVKAGTALDPVKVIQVGASAFLVDGHHRIEAYKLAGHAKPIPVAYFKGTIEDAVLEAGRENSKAKLPMTNQERQDYAWRLVKMGTYTGSQIKEATTVSVRQIANMRSVLKALGVEATGIDSWWKARRAAAIKPNLEITDDELEERLNAQAADYANRMARSFSTKLATNPELAARAFDIYFGRKLPQLVRHLKEYVLDAEFDEDEGADF